MLREPQCDLGWNWTIALAPFGVADRSRIRIESKPPRTAAIVVQQDHRRGVRISATSERGASAEVAEGQASEDCFAFRPGHLRTLHLAVGETYAPTPKFLDLHGVTYN
jgi:hypothetical protein